MSYRTTSIAITTAFILGLLSGIFVTTMLVVDDYPSIINLGCYASVTLLVAAMFMTILGILTGENINEM